MNVFYPFLIVVGLAIGAGLAALVMLDLRRRDDDVSATESRAEATWIAEALRRADVAADPEAVEEVLRLHRAYLAGIPDDRDRRATTDVEVEFDEPVGVRAVAVANGDSIGDPAAPEWTDEEAQAAHDTLEALLDRGRTQG